MKFFLFNNIDGRQKKNKTQTTLKLLSSIIIAVYGFFTFAVSADDAISDEKTQVEKKSIQALSQSLGALHTFQGNFQQVITDEDNEIVEENEGRFLLKRPGFFRWYIKPPFEKLMVSNNKTIWTYDPDLKQATADIVDDRLLQTPMLLLSGDLEQIHSNYSVSMSLSKQADDNKKRRISYKLIPKNNAGLFEWMEILFSDDKIIEMTLFSELGEKQHYIFTETQQNKNIEDSEFTFDVPPDVDVIVND